MKPIVRMIVISMIPIVVLFSTASCSPSISQEEYNSVKNELSDCKSQVEALQGKLDEAMIKELQYDQLNIQHQELKKQYDAQSGEIQTIKSDFDELSVSYEQLMQQDNARIDEMQAIQAEYDNLNQEFEELKRQYDIIVQRKAVFSEEEIDQAIFELINQERKNNGLDELEWGVNLYGWAKQNSRAMAEKGDYTYSSWSSWQAVLITAGQATLDGLANGALIVWKQQKLEFSRYFLDTKSPYGAVATIKSGDAYYITYMASNFP
jgi:uncharacterized membrane protein (DUF106 family)